MNLLRVKRHARWLMPTALFALAPKCLVCVVAYAGLGTAFGLGGPELCGGSTGPSLHWSSWVALLAIIGGGAGLIARTMQRERSAAIRVTTDTRKIRRR